MTACLHVDRDGYATLTVSRDHLAAHPEIEAEARAIGADLRVYPEPDPPAVVDVPDLTAADRYRAVRAALGYDPAPPSPHLDRLRHAADRMLAHLGDPERLARWRAVAREAAAAWATRNPAGS